MLADRQTHTQRDVLITILRHGSGRRNNNKSWNSLHRKQVDAENEILIARSGFHVRVMMYTWCRSWLSANCSILSTAISVTVAATGCMFARRCRCGCRSVEWTCPRVFDALICPHGRRRQHPLSFYTTGCLLSISSGRDASRRWMAETSCCRCPAGRAHCGPSCTSRRAHLNTFISADAGKTNAPQFSRQIVSAAVCLEFNTTSCAAHSLAWAARRRIKRPDVTEVPC